jgi:polyferredoxin
VIARTAARLSLLFLLVLLPTVVGIARAQPSEAPPREDAAAPAAADEPGADGWNFPDEEEDEPTLAQVIAPQAIDLVLFPAFLALALVSFFRKSVTLKYVTLAAAVIYLGIARSQLISVVNIFSLLSWNLPIFKYSLFWYLFAGFTVVSTVLWGRLYCGRLCACGALTQLMDRVVPAKLRYEVPLRVETRVASVKYVLLGAVIVYFFATRDIRIYRYVEPFWMFSGQGSAIMWAGLATLLVATVFVRNLYCRFLCPVGAFLGVIATATTVFSIKRWAECRTCRICEKTCEWGAIQGPRIVKSECVRCDDCERLYMDQQKCVHWVVIRRKSEIMARRSAPPAEPAGF